MNNSDTLHDILGDKRFTLCLPYKRSEYTQIIEDDVCYEVSNILYKTQSIRINQSLFEGLIKEGWVEHTIGRKFKDSEELKITEDDIEKLLPWKFLLQCDFDFYHSTINLSDTLNIIDRFAIQSGEELSIFLEFVIRNQRIDFPWKDFIRYNIIGSLDVLYELEQYGHLFYRTHRVIEKFHDIELKEVSQLSEIINFIKEENSLLDVTVYDENNRCIYGDIITPENSQYQDLKKLFIPHEGLEPIGFIVLEDVEKVEKTIASRNMYEVNGCISSHNFYQGRGALSFDKKPLYSDGFSNCNGVFMSDNTGNSIGLHIEPDPFPTRRFEEYILDFYTKNLSISTHGYDDSEITFFLEHALKYFFYQLHEKKEREKFIMMLQDINAKLGITLQVINKGYSNMTTSSFLEQVQEWNTHIFPEINISTRYHYSVMYLPQEQQIMVNTYCEQLQKDIIAIFDVRLY